MKWRFLKLDWKYAVGELVIVTVGVLIALGAGGWLEDRQEQALEQDYIERMIKDLRSDLESISIIKVASMDRAQYAQNVLTAYDNKSISISPSELARSVEYAAYFSYPSYAKTTFDDLMSTGNLRLIRSNEIKEAIAMYYAEIEWTGQFRDLIIPVQSAATVVNAEILTLAQRLALSQEGVEKQCGGPGLSCYGNIPWAPTQLSVTAKEAEEILDRLLARPDARALYANMARNQGQLYSNLSSIEQLATESISILEQYID
jgi:hypothetical protein